MRRTLSASQVLKVSNETISLAGGWFDCFGEIDRTGIVFIAGPSTGGKSSAALSLAKALSEFGRTLYLSNEEGYRSSFQERLRRFAVTECGTRIQFLNHESVCELIGRLGKRRAADFVVVDSIQDTKMTRAEYEQLKQMSLRKMIIFVSRIEGRLPVGRLARQIKFDADLKVWVEGGRATSEGRYIGAVGAVDVLPDKAKIYYGSTLKEEHEK